jgi:predicted RND superfamily exporter protein
MVKLSALGSAIRRLVFVMVDFGGRWPYLVVGAGLALLAASWSYARTIEVRSDVMELLPRDSAGFKAFERRLERVGGRATITVVVESPDRAANERFIDALDAKLRAALDERARCLRTCDSEAACTAACGPELIAFIESGTKEVRAFFERNKWLFADLAELEDADATLDHQIAIRGGLVEDLGDEAEKPESTLGMDRFREGWQRRADEHDDFPTGYFASPDGTQMALFVVSNGTGLGRVQDDQLIARVQRLVEELAPESFHPQLRVGLGGDLPNAKAEKDALRSEALTATGIVLVLILLGVRWFYGSSWAIPLVFFPPLFGVGCAFAFATWRYGYVNTSGAFLGAIILGNGVNYPIVLYSRYKEFRARGMVPDVARREAVWNAFRAELVGATVASIAYGSLTVTRFRGFSQFGVIGFIGMLLVWISMIPCLPASLVLMERMQARLPRWMREKPAKLGEDESRSRISRAVGNATERWPLLFVGLAAVVTILAAVKLPGYLRDPWEYDFDKLGSKGARASGAYQWSAKANRILERGKGEEGFLVLADKPEQVPLVKERILANDAADPKGKLLDRVSTLQDFLPGTPEEQVAKLEVLARIRERITPSVLSRLDEDEAKKVSEMRPPEALHVIGSDDLPPLLKHRFTERDGTIGTPFYVFYRQGVSRNDGHILLRLSTTIDGIVLPDGTKVATASRSTVFAEMIRALEHDGPVATAVSFVSVVIVVLLATASKRGAFAVVLSLVMGVTWTLGLGAWLGVRLNFLNFVALPITFGIGSEYPFNIYDRSRLLGGDVTRAVKLHFGAVALCSYTTVIGYGSLLFSDNQALRSFGKLAITGEIACVIGALFFLPSVLHLIARRSRAMPEASLPREELPRAGGARQQAPRPS